LKHHFFDRDETLARMVPGLRAPAETEPPPRDPLRLAVLGLGFALITAAAAAAIVAVANLDTAAPEAPASRFETTDTATVESAPEATQIAPAPAPAGVSAWTVDQRASSIGFGYVYSDDSGASPFEGRFARWRADIRFDPNDLDHSSVVVRIETASAQTGVAVHDGALPGPGWFNAAEHPTAEFRSTRIRARGEGQYEARGDLTIKGRTRSVDLPFTLSIASDRASMNGRTTIDRRDFGVGEDDAGDDLISRQVDISVRVEATRAP
jgi:polyisoprenoid-binding protein YceI